MKQTTDVELDLAGVGAGPFNLSVAALLSEMPTVRARFFESREAFVWHPGLLLDTANMQTMFLKDLVSAVRPENPYSFLSYLVKNKKFYRFLSAELSCISRQEFSDYLAWTAHQLPNIQFNSEIEHIEFTGDHFAIQTQQGQYRAKNLCLGVGKVPLIPDCAKPYISQRVFHASEIGLKDQDFTGKRVMIIGGGQSGADIFLNALQNQWGQPKSLDWVSRRANYQPLDEAAFTNEYFTPDYVEAFYHLDAQVKRHEIAQQKLTSDGITQQSLLEIYRALYHRFDVLKEEKWIRLLPHRTLTQLRQSTGSDAGYQLTVTNALSQQQETHAADVVILATGFAAPTPACLSDILPLLDLDENNRYTMDSNFELQWEGQATNKIFAVNAGLHSHGIAEPQLSLMAWRSAKIINALVSRDAFDLSTHQGMIEWLTHQPAMEPVSSPL